MIYGDVVFGFISFLISIVFFIMSQSFKAGTSDGVPGAGFFPSIICVIIMFFSALLIFQGIKKRKHYFSQLRSIREIPENTKNLIITALALIVFFLVWRYVHFIAGITLFLLTLNAVYKQKILTNIIYTVVCVTVVYAVFGRIFHVMF